MSNAYSYDAVDNILGMENSISPQSNKGMNPSKLGGTFSHSYRYDKLDRLVNASGKAKNASCYGHGLQCDEYAPAQVSGGGFLIDGP